MIYRSNACRRVRLRWRRRLGSWVCLVERVRGEIGVEERRRGRGQREAGDVPSRAGAACRKECLLCSCLLCLTDCFEIKRHFICLSSDSSLYLVQACSRPSLTSALKPLARRASTTCGNVIVQQQNVYHEVRARVVPQAMGTQGGSSAPPRANRPLTCPQSRTPLNMQ